MKSKSEGINGKRKRKGTEVKRKIEYAEKIKNKIETNIKQW